MKTGKACDSPIDCQVNNTVKAQKSMKGIVKIVHLPPVVQSWTLWSNENNFVCKENENNDFIQQFVLSASPVAAILENIHWTQIACAVLCQCGADDTEQHM